MGVELLVADEFGRWFEWLAAADPEVAGEVAAVADLYAEAASVLPGPTYEVCVSPTGRLAFVVVHEGRVVFLAAGAEIDGSERRVVTLIARARKVTRRLRQGKLELQPWVEVRRWLNPWERGAVAR